MVIIMEFIPKNIQYPESEKEKLRQIETLFEKWYKNFKGKIFIKNYTADNMVFDGLYYITLIKNEKFFLLVERVIKLVQTTSHTCSMHIKRNTLVINISTNIHFIGV